MLAGSMHDLVVRLELPQGRANGANRTECAGEVGDADHPGGTERTAHRAREWLECHLGKDPRVRVAPPRPALAEFPASPFHVTLPAGRPLHTDVVRRLRAELGTAVIGRAVFSDGSRAQIVRA